MTQLDGGDTLSAFTLNIGADSTLTLPDDMETDNGIVLFYRGHW